MISKLLRRFSLWQMKRTMPKVSGYAPVIISENDIVIEGNRRVITSRALGHKLIPAIRIPSIVVMVDPLTLKLSCDDNFSKETE